MNPQTNPEKDSKKSSQDNYFDNYFDDYFDNFKNIKVSNGPKGPKAQLKPTDRLDFPFPLPPTPTLSVPFPGPPTFYAFTFFSDKFSMPKATETFLLGLSISSTVSFHF